MENNTEVNIHIDAISRVKMSYGVKNDVRSIATNEAKTDKSTSIAYITRVSRYVVIYLDSLDLNFNMMLKKEYFVPIGINPSMCYKNQLSQYIQQCFI